jgi:hypothetical protein
MNAVFTIVAKNYLPLAHALGWSLKKQNKTPYNFIIVVADNTIDHSDPIFLPEFNYLSVYDLGLDNLDELAFKYTITEFCTSIKPACFNYFMKHTDGEYFIYFDPDIFVFDDISNIINQFDNKSIVVTPHYTTPEAKYTGDQVDSSTLFVGIFNFGFVGFRKTEYSKTILNWWHNRLMNQAYADYQDALHTDQKWMDFLPAFNNDELSVSKNLGMNLAPWNLFEREILPEKNSAKFLVRNKFTNEIFPLVFVHFAGYDPNNENVIHKDFLHLKIDKYPYYKFVRDCYDKITSDYKFKEIKNLPYKFGVFNNGKSIQYYHRRIYRALLEDGQQFSHIFSEKGELYLLFNQANMITNDNPIKYTSKNKEELGNKIKYINKLFKIAYKILGANKYFTFLKYLNRYSRPENQIFLVNKKIDKFY